MFRAPRLALPVQRTQLAPSLRSNLPSLLPANELTLPAPDLNSLHVSAKSWTIRTIGERRLKVSHNVSQATESMWCGSSSCSGHPQLQRNLLCLEPWTQVWCIPIASRGQRLASVQRKFISSVCSISYKVQTIKKLCEARFEVHS